ncbi:hypothetical protein DVW83_13365 [Enterococcus sp. VV15]|uniref:hypothetical protein n=1 Tax=Enterococcus sp. VV15 TaxID=2233541 RepID=UPI0010C1C096|nr:hypothetical protein [Enterococcus sp. VV15]TKN14837.1 hypothetical protein DVW83_13365 [Enterococcus sp. VV15]
MSSYYFIVKKEILNKKQFLGLDSKFSYYFLCVVEVLFICSFISSVNSSSTINNDKEAYAYLALMFICYTGMKLLNRSIVSSNWESAYKLRDKITDKNLDNLIQEVEQSIRNIKRFTEWGIGVLVTLIVLISTLTLNILLKDIDIFLKVIDNTILKEFFKEDIKQFEGYSYDLSSDMMNLFFDFFLLFSSFVFLGYLIFSSFSLVKKQVLITLYDIRYIRNLNEECNEGEKEETGCNM